MARNEKTSKKVASKAAKQLRSRKSSKAAKSVAGSALTQAPDKKRSRKTLVFRALQTAATRYGRDYGLGDLATYEESNGAEHDMKIVATDITQAEDGKETIVLFLEEE